MGVIKKTSTGFIVPNDGNRRPPAKVTSNPSASAREAMAQDARQRREAPEMAPTRIDTAAKTPRRMPGGGTR